MCVRFLSVLAVLLCCSISIAEEIPLDQIWALDMPGTKDVRELEEDLSGFNLTPEERLKHSSALHISRILSRLVERGEIVPPGFAVEGTGKKALENALAAFKGTSNEIHSGDEVSIVFYTARTGRYVYLDSVERIGNKIVLTYHLVFHSTLNLTTHFALIPLGKLPTGKYSVSIKRGPSLKTDELVEIREEKAEVCGEFQFQVKE